MGKDSFISWLEDNTNLSSYTIRRYSGAIDVISSELDGYGLDERDLYSITDTKIVDLIFLNSTFRKKNAKGNRMYSAALKYFKDYIENYRDDERFQAELLREELQFEKYLLVNDLDEKKRNIEDKKRAKPEHKRVNNRKIWSRNSIYANEAIFAAGYLCEFNNEHQHFISKFSKKTTRKLTI